MQPPPAFDVGKKIPAWIGAHSQENLSTASEVFKMMLLRQAECGEKTFFFFDQMAMTRQISRSDFGQNWACPLSALLLYIVGAPPRPQGLPSVMQTVGRIVQKRMLWIKKKKKSYVMWCKNKDSEEEVQKYHKLNW